MTVERAKEILAAEAKRLRTGAGGGDINHNALVKLHVVEYKPRNPESPRALAKFTLFVHRDRIVSVSHLPSEPRQ